MNPGACGCIVTGVRFVHASRAAGCRHAFRELEESVRDDVRDRLARQS